MARVRLNQVQSRELGEHLQRLAEYEPERSNVVEILPGVSGQLTVNGTWLHSDGEWATYPERERGSLFTVGAVVRATHRGVNKTIIRVDRHPESGVPAYFLEWATKNGTLKREWVYVGVVHEDYEVVQ